MEKRIEYRCTRQKPYDHDCLGQYNTGSRQGHYRVVENEEEAVRRMVEDFPDDVKAGYGFTVQQCRPVRGTVFEWSVRDGLRTSALKGMG
jgi:hypothetical protein